MQFNIITPSYNHLYDLKQCLESVRDQVPERSLEATGENKVYIHHHVQDGESSDGTVEWLREYVETAAGSEENASISYRYLYSYASSKDEGMYDAINRGIEHVESLSDGSTNAIMAWLNCDEQYLPGTLEYVSAYFEQHPDVDILFGDYLIVDASGELLSFRKGSPIRLRYIQASHLYNLSCTMFFRSEVYDALAGFNTTFKAAADEDFVIRALKAGFKAKHVRRYFSTFTLTNNNLGASDLAEQERQLLKTENPVLLRKCSFLFNIFRWLEKLFHGTYVQQFPLKYAIYVENLSIRKEMVSDKVSWQWPR